jgi:hypothetical protein
LQYLIGKDGLFLTLLMVKGTVFPRRIYQMAPVLKALRLFLLFGLLMAVTGCGHWQHDIFPAPSFNPTGTASPRITQKDQVIVQPGGQYLHPHRAGLLTFRTVPDFAEVGVAFTQFFYRELLAKRTFAEVELIPETCTTKEEALRLAKRHKLDVMLMGEVPYYLDGGTVGTSGLQVDLKVIEAPSGRLLVTLSDSLKATRRTIVDLIVTESRPFPTPSMGTLASRLAGRLAATLEQGQPPPPPGGVSSWFNWGT